MSVTNLFFLSEDHPRAAFWGQGLWLTSVLQVGGAARPFKETHKPHFGSWSGN